MDHSVLNERNEIDTAIPCIDYAPHAHKHIPLFLKLDIYDINEQQHNNHFNNNNNESASSSLFDIKVITNGKDLTSFKIRNGDISLQHPIIVKDSPQSIGMRVSIEQVVLNGNKKLSPTKKVSASNHNKKRRKRNKDDDDEDDDNNDNSLHVSSTRTCNIIRTIGNIVGPGAEVSMIDVRTQQLVEGDYTFGQLCDYFDDEKRLMIIGRHQHQQQEQLKQEKQQKEQQTQQNNNNNGSSSRRMPRRKVTTKYDMNGIMDLQILNQVSYEFSRSKLNEYVRSPQFVREIDWIDIVWPNNFRHDENAGNYPAVQYYCLTSCAGSYMDYHIDFGGSSVWYHIVSGRKEFCLILPTSENLIQYENWLCNPKQNHIFLPDNIYDKNTIRRIILYENQTMIIPSGYIHSVYTPIDSIVFGGNFLHGYDIEMQNKIYDIETRRKVLDKYLFPYYIESNIYASSFYLKKMKSGEISIRELNQLSFLLDALNKWIIDNNDNNNDDVINNDNDTNVVLDSTNTDIPTKYKAIQYVLKEHQLTSFPIYLDKLRQEIKRNEIDGISRSNDPHMITTMTTNTTTSSSSFIDPLKQTPTLMQALEATKTTSNSKVTAPQNILLQAKGTKTLIKNDAKPIVLGTTKKSTVEQKKRIIKIQTKGTALAQNDNKPIKLENTKKAATTVKQKKGTILTGSENTATVTKSNDNDPVITSSKNDVVLIQNTLSNDVDTKNVVELPKKSSSRIVIKREKNDNATIKKEIKLSSSKNNDDDMTPADKKAITVKVTKSNGHNTVANEGEPVSMLEIQDQSKNNNNNVTGSGPSSLEEIGRTVDGKASRVRNIDPHKNIEEDNSSDRLKESSSIIPNSPKNRKIRIKVNATGSSQTNDNVNPNESSVISDVPSTSISSSVPEDPAQPPTNPKPTKRQKKIQTATANDSETVEAKQDQAETVLATLESIDTLNKSDDIEDDDNNEEDNDDPKFRVQLPGDTYGVRRSRRSVSRRDWSDLGKNNAKDEDDEEFIDTSSGNNKKKMKKEVAKKNISTTNKQEKQSPKGKKKTSTFIASIVKKPSQRISTSRQRLKMKTEKKSR